MSTCTTCYGTNTAQPCASVGCLSTNYAKCISYSGANLFCQQGSIATFTFTGVAVSSPVDVTVTASVTGGNGTDATFVVVRKAGQTTYEVTLENQGAGYEVSDVLTIPGNLLGGATPANDVAISITGLTPVIANGSNLDSVIANLNNRLCLVSTQSPSGLDYTAFNYQCLRVGGNLESVGTPITTAQGFTEAVAAALCSLNTRVKSVEVPQIIVDSYFGGSIISGTSTLVQILNKYGEAIGDINDKFTINSPHTCNTFTHLTNLTTKPSPTASLGTWFDWVSTNLCNNYTILDGKITEQNTEHALINTFLYGINQPYPLSRGNNFVNTACLSGGSATSDVRTAVNLIATRLCSLTTQVNSLANPTYTLDWSSCFSGSYPTNSLWGVQNTIANPSPLSGFVNTTTLQTHLDQIVKVLSNLNLKAGSGITFAYDGCGATISATSSGFQCSELNNCNLDAMKDVTYAGVDSVGTILVRRIKPGSSPITNEWVNSNLRYIVNRINGPQTIFPTYNSANNSLDLTLNFPSFSKVSLSSNVNTSGPVPNTFGFLSTPLSAPAASNYPQLILDNNTGVCNFYGDTGFTLNNNTGTTIVLTQGTEIFPFTTALSNSVYFPENAPTNGRNITSMTTGIRLTTGNVFVGTSSFIFKIYSQSNFPFTVPGVTIAPISIIYQGPTVNVLAGQYFDFHIGGLSWSVI